MWLIIVIVPCTPTNAPLIDVVWISMPTFSRDEGLEFDEETGFVLYQFFKRISWAFTSALFPTWIVRVGLIVAVIEVTPTLMLPKLTPVIDTFSKVLIKFVKSTVFAFILALSAISFVIVDWIFKIITFTLPL